MNGPIMVSFSFLFGRYARGANLVTLSPRAEEDEAESASETTTMLKTAKANRAKVAIRSARNGLKRYTILDSRAVVLSMV